MTDGENYNLNKEIFNNEAKKFIDKFLKNKGDKVHRPFEMMTYYKRDIIEKITDDKFLCYTGYVKNTEYDVFKKILNYSGKKNDIEIYTLKKLINMFGFEISTNPNSNSNKLIKKSI